MRIHHEVHLCMMVYVKVLEADHLYSLSRQQKDPLAGAGGYRT